MTPLTSERNLTQNSTGFGSETVTKTGVAVLLFHIVYCAVPVLKDQVSSDVIGFPARSFTPVNPPLTGAVSIMEPDSAADGTKVAVSLFINYGHGVATLTPTNVYLCPLLLVNLNVNFPVAGSSVPEKVPSSMFPPIMS